MGTYYSFKNKKCYLGAINFLLLIAVVVGGAYYLVGMNNLVVKGFKLEELRHQVGVLNGANQDFKNKKLAMESYGSLDQKIKDLKLVAIDQIEYISVGSEVLAKK
ncbi:MAG TPA: hypothetical protein PKI61_02970 [bacterium]|nr:hypothetical protein [bacterium]HPT29604.1 hypothetical protein [bacterium]